MAKTRERLSKQFEKLHFKQKVIEQMASEGDERNQVFLQSLRHQAVLLKRRPSKKRERDLVANRKLLRELAGDAHFVTAYIPNPALTPTALRYALADELGINYHRNMGQHRVMQMIDERLV